MTYFSSWPATVYHGAAPDFPLHPDNPDVPTILVSGGNGPSASLNAQTDGGIKIASISYQDFSTRTKPVVGVKLRFTVRLW